MSNESSEQNEILAPAEAEQIHSLRIPVHLGIIMDGNGRWAKNRGLERSAGHKEGTRTAKKIVEASARLGIKYLTLYTFSKENWSRPKQEVSFLFDLLVDFLGKELPDLQKNGIQLRVLGEKDKLPFAVRKVLDHAISVTQKNQNMVLNLALNYSGRDEIIRACKNFAATGRSFAELTEELFSDFLYTEGQPDPDLILRTSGEQRLSNFLPFQAAYSEFYFTDVLWPDFTPKHLEEALSAFTSRDRRFGGVSPKPAE